MGSFKLSDGGPKGRDKVQSSAQTWAPLVIDQRLERGAWRPDVLTGHQSHRGARAKGVQTRRMG